MVGARSNGGDMAAVWGSQVPNGRTPRILGLFAHPDDEVFCVGGTIARCADEGADTALVSLTRGEAGQIRDAAAATRRTLGAVRATELVRAADALGVGSVTCLDLGDGRLGEQPMEEIAATARMIIDDFQPDVVVTFGPDGGYGHPDHIASCLATVEAIRTLADPPRLLHAQFPLSKQLLLDLIVEWLTSNARRFRGTTEFGHTLKLFADGSSMLGLAADHFDVEWFPAGSFVIEQGGAATALYCILSGSVDIVIETDDGRMHTQASASAGSFFGEDGLASSMPRNAHVIARDDVTCLVLAPGQPSASAARDAGATVAPAEAQQAITPTGAGLDAPFSVDVRGVLDRKVAALSAHWSQYAMERDLFPRSVLERLLGTEHFAVATPNGLTIRR